MATMLSDELKRLRKKHNMTLDELAGLMGVSTELAAGWEAGQMPEPGQLADLARTLGTTTDRLLEKTPSEVLNMEGLGQEEQAILRRLAAYFTDHGCGRRE